MHRVNDQMPDPTHSELEDALLHTQNMNVTLTKRAAVVSALRKLYRHVMGA